LIEELEISANDATRNDLVVVHTRDGMLVKGYLRWMAASAGPRSLPALPDVLQIHHEAEGEISTVELADVKAVFFVKTPQGNVEYSEVKFLADEPASDLWIRARLMDGESMEGRTENNSSILFAAGFWLRPTDCVANNVMVYVPKSSVVEFHVMGSTTARERHRSADKRKSISIRDASLT
jgi:Family of unknown function (DUF6982)